MRHIQGEMHESEEERFRELYTRHRYAVTAYVRRRAPAHAVEDIVAETFLVCWRRRERVPSEALPWLYAVAFKTLANERRKREYAERAAGASAPAPSVEPLPVNDPLLAAAFASLGERDREVLCLIAWEGLAVQEAADVIGCSAVACRVRLHRAKRRLAEQLAHAETNPPARANPLSEGATR